MRHPILAVLAWAIVCGGLAAAQPMDPPQPPRQVSVSGEGVIYVVPDEAVVFFGIAVEDAQLGAAKRRADEAAAGLVEAIKAFGIEARDIQASMLQIDAARSPREPYELRGYNVTMQHTVVLRDVAKLPGLIELGVSSGANRFNGFAYRSGKSAEQLDEARRKAVRAARAKAELLASELGASIGEVLSIDETGGMMPLGRMPQMANVAFDAAGAPEGDTMPAGQIELRARVQVSFRLVD